MGREVKRVPMAFDWPINSLWWGYTLHVPCEYCGGAGSKPVEHEHCLFPDQPEKVFHRSTDCPLCEGTGKAYVRIDPPTGPGWQMWETCSEGSPISPVCESPEALARWLADNGASAFGYQTASYDEWLGMIKGGGHSVTAVLSRERGIESGVAEAARQHAEGGSK